MNVRPDAEMGYRACLNASAGPVPEGSVEAGTGATVGKITVPFRRLNQARGAPPAAAALIVAALVAVNAFGDALTGREWLLAGPRNRTVMERTAGLRTAYGDFPGIPLE